MAPVAFDLDEIQEEPPTTPVQDAPTFTRNVVLTIVAGVVAFAGLGIAGIVSLTLPDDPMVSVGAVAPASQGDRDKARADNDLPFWPFEDTVSQVSRFRPALQSTLPVDSDAPATDVAALQPASAMKSPVEGLIDEAAVAARLRCLDASELQPTLLVGLQFAQDGTVAAVELEGASDYPAETVACVESVFGELVIDAERGSKVTFVRQIGDVR